MSAAWGYAIALLVGAGGAWYVEAIRWDNDIAARDLETAKAISVNVSAVNDQLVASRKETEAIRANYIDYKAGKERETNDLERAVAAGTKRLSVRANCSAVPGAGTSTIGTQSGTAVLTADAGRSYYAYRRAYDAQFADFKLCRGELIKRSSK